MAQHSGNRPTHYISVTAQVRKGKYEKGPYIGLWEGKDGGPLFRGSVRGKYADELFDFLKDHGDDDIGFAVFESQGDRGGSKRRSRDDEDEDRGSSRGRSKRERDEDEDEKPSRRGNEKKSKKRDWEDD